MELAKALMLDMTIRGIKETCTPDAKGEYKTSDLLSQAWSLRSHFEGSLFGELEANAVDVVDMYISSLMALVANRKAAASAPSSLTTQPKPVQLKKQRKDKKKK